MESETIHFMPDRQDSLADIVQENFSEDMEDKMGYQEHMELLKDSEPIADYHNKEEESSLVEKALEVSLLYGGCGPYRGGLMHDGRGGYSRYGDSLNNNQYGYNAPMRHPSQDLNINRHMPSMDYIDRIREREEKRREDLYNNWATEQRKHDDPFQCGIGLPGVKSEEHFHGSDPDHLSSSHIQLDPFNKKTDHPWFDNGYNASMRDYNAEIRENMNRFLNRSNDDY